MSEQTKTEQSKAVGPAGDCQPCEDHDRYRIRHIAPHAACCQLMRHRAGCQNEWLRARRQMEPGNGKERLQPCARPCQSRHFADSISCRSVAAVSYCLLRRPRSLCKTIEPSQA